MQNPEIARVLDEIADLLKVGEHNFFSGHGISYAARMTSRVRKKEV